MDADLRIESDTGGDLEAVGSPLVRELNEVFQRHGFDGGFIFSAFALDGERWRFDSGIVLDEEQIPECERAEVIGDALRMVALSAQDMGVGDA